MTTLMEPARRSPAAVLPGAPVPAPLRPGPRSLVRRGAPGQAGPPSLIRAVLSFALAGLVGVVVLGGAGTAVLMHVGKAEALHEACLTTELEARVLEPDVTDALVAGDRDALATLDRRVRNRVLGDRVRSVKLWDAQGRVVYADHADVVGMTFPLGEDQRAVFATGRPTSDLTDLSAAENRLDPDQGGRLLEVYELVHTPAGQPLLFEAYLRYDSVTASARRVWTAFAPALLAALVALELLQLPLAWRLTRRLQQGQREREALHQRAVDASATERRRIAADLHDGVVQTFTAVSYWLAAVQDEVTAGCGQEVSDRVGVAAATTRRGIRELRTLLVDIYPPSLRASGLSAALHDLVAPLPARGLTPLLSLPEPAPTLPAPLEELLYRVAQEAVRNVQAHARATRVDLTLARTPDGVVLEVQDDGQGLPDPAGLDERPRLGLRLLSETAAAVGGRLELGSAPGHGTTLRVEVPVP